MQVNKIKAETDKLGISISIDKTNGKIALTGNVSEVHEIYFKVKELLFAARKEKEDAERARMHSGEDATRKKMHAEEDAERSRRYTEENARRARVHAAEDAERSRRHAAEDAERAKMHTQLVS